ncbi:MAG: S9 family peptidase [bacterium]
MKRTIFFLVVFLLLFSSCKDRGKKTDASAEKKETTPVKTEIGMADYLDIIGSSSGHVLDDGRKLYLSREKQEATQLFIQEKDGSHVKLTNTNEPVRSYKVNPDGTMLLYKTSEGGNEQFDIFLLNLENKKIKPLLVDSDIRYDSIVWADKASFFYTSNEVNGKDFYIYRYDLDNKKQPFRLVVEKSGYNIVSDAVNRKKFLFYTYVGNNITVPWEYVEGKTRKIKGADKKRLYEPVAYFDDSILMLTNEKNDMSYLELWKNGKKKAVHKDRSWSVETVVVDKRSRSQLVFCINEEGFSSCFRFKKSEKPEPVSLEKGIIRLSQLKSEMLVYRSRVPDEVPTPVIFHLTTDKRKKFGYEDNNGIDVSEFVKPELRKVDSFDGVEIPYFLYIPEKAEKPYKTIIYFHGGPSSQFRPSFIRSFQYYLSRGFMIAAPNFRGSSGYGQKFMDMDNYKKRMDAVKDGAAVLDALIEESLTKKGMIAARGGSYGGFMTVASMAQYPDYYRCGINNVGVVDFVNFLKNTSSYRRKLREVEYGPLSDKEFLKKISPTNMVESIEGELLVIHGENDSRVPVTDAHILVDRMKKHGKKVQTLFFPDEGHGYRKRKNMMKYYETNAEFLKNCMKPGEKQ